MLTALRDSVQALHLVFDDCLQAQQPSALLCLVQSQPTRARRGNFRPGRSHALRRLRRLR
eukprot:763990-Hanusia_phi.AAC.6